MNENQEQQSGTFLPVTQVDLDVMKSQKEVLRNYVSSQMTEANFKDSKADNYGEGDFGVIPGTKKRSLLKPGAEKLLRLFSMGVRVRLSDKTIDKNENFAMFTYRAEVYHLRSGITIAECEASANSQEVKYRERTEWKRKTVNGKPVNESVKVPTPVFDVLNTLMKMAQKRAMVGATILATGASDFFTSDMEPDEIPVSAAEEKEVGPTQSSEPSAPPICCDNKPMMVSKYPNKDTGEFEYYCLKCKSKKPSGIF